MLATACGKHVSGMLQLCLGCAALQTSPAPFPPPQPPTHSTLTWSFGRQPSATTELLVTRHCTETEEQARHRQSGLVSRPVFGLPG
jgi:hypothetical protein